MIRITCLLAGYGKAAASVSALPGALRSGVKPDEGDSSLYWFALAIYLKNQIERETQVDQRTLAPAYE